MPVKKEFLTRPVNGNTQLLELYYQGGGEVPKRLSGMYTSRREALNAASLYLKSRIDRKPVTIKEVKDGED